MQLTALRRWRRPADRGAVAVVTALMLLPMLLVAALVIDIGNVRDQRRQWQNAADAGALAAATALYPASTCRDGSQPPCFGDAGRAATSLVGRNSSVTSAMWAACRAGVAGAAPGLPYVPAGTSSCISYDASAGPTLVRVTVPTQTSPAFFAGITGTSSFSVAASADAKVGTAVTCTLCFLGDVDARNADFTVNGGAIAVAGDVDAGPNSTWTSTANQVSGSVSGGRFSPAVTPISPFSDPLASLPLPLSTAGLVARTNPCTDGPGLYLSAVTLSPSKGASSCVLQPGLYVVRNTWTLSNNTLLTGSGVTLYAQSPNGYLDLKNGFVGISAPTDAGNPLQGFAIVYDRDNTNPLTLQGNGQTSFTGGIYLAHGGIVFNGSSCLGVDTGPVVALTVGKANGNQSCVTITHAKDRTVAHAATYLAR